jgi:hypothetical protein
MGSELSEGILTLKHHLDAMDRNTPDLPKILHEIEGLIHMCDRLVECKRPPAKTIQHYSRLRHRYKDFLASYRGLEGEIAACSMQIAALIRQNKMNEIEHGIHEIVAVSDYITHAIESQDDAIDSITRSFDSQLEQGELINEHLEQIHRRKSGRCGFVRVLLLVALFLVVFVVLAKSIF